MRFDKTWIDDRHMAFPWLGAAIVENMVINDSGMQIVSCTVFEAML